MNNNQKYLNECIQAIFNTLGRYDRAVKLYGTEKESIVHGPWNNEELERRLSAAASKLQDAAQLCYDGIHKELEGIRKTATAMEQEFALTLELNAAIALVSAVGDKLPWDTRQNLVTSFVGHKQALIALRSIFEAKGVEIKEVKSYIFDASICCDVLDNAAYQLVAQAGANVGVVFNLVKELETFAKLEGVELSSKFISENTDVYMNARLRESFGLPAAAN